MACQALQTMEKPDLGQTNEPGEPLATPTVLVSGTGPVLPGQTLTLLSPPLRPFRVLCRACLQLSPVPSRLLTFFLFARTVSELAAASKRLEKGLLSKVCLASIHACPTQIRIFPND